MRKDKCILLETGEIIGKVYIYPVKENKLLAKEIEMNWFAVDRRGEGNLNAGSIDRFGRWSIFLPGEEIPEKEGLLPEEALSLVLSIPVSEFKLVDVDENNKKKQAEDNDNTGEDDEGAELFLELEQIPLIESESCFVAKSTVIPPTIRKNLEQQLAVIMIETYKREKQKFKDENKQKYWQMTISVEKNLLVLRSRSDGHKVIAVSIDGEVKSPLSELDAQILIQNASRPQVKEIVFEQQVEEKKQDPSQSLSLKKLIPPFKLDLEQDFSQKPSKESKDGGFSLE